MRLLLMHFFMKKIIVFCILLVIVSCKKAKESECIIIDLATGIHEKNPAQISDLNDIAKVQYIIPIETNDSSLLSYVQIAGVGDESIGVYDNHSFFLINKEDGKILSCIQKTGNGPEEYISINQAKMDANKLVYITDFHRKRLNVYTLDGKRLSYIENDSINKFDIFDDGYFATTTSTNSNTKYNIAIYDSLWNFKRNGLPKKNDINFAIIYSEGTYKYNNELYFKSIIGDTIYHIRPEADKPYLVFNKGIYKMPDELRGSLSEMDAQKHKYINSEQVLIVSKYLFIKYLYDRKWYYDIWNIETSNLLYRSIYSPTGGKPGIPLIIESKIMNVWPCFVFGDYLYCNLEGESQNLIPSLLEDSNPVIIELKIN